MPIFLHLDLEKRVQTNDRTRLDASKTYITSNEEGFSKLSIKPALDEPAIPVFSAQARERFLDWEYRDFKIDVDSTNNKIDFAEGGSPLAATITDGTYTRAQLESEIKAQLESAGSLTYTVSFDVDDKLTISANGAFDLASDGPNKNSLLTVMRFFDFDQATGQTSYTSARVEYMTRKITATAGEDTLQVQSVSCTANATDLLNNKYFFIWSAVDATKYYVWYNSNAGGTDPNISGLTGVMVALASSDTAGNVATKTAAALQALADFNASATGAVVTVTNADPGWASPAYNGTTSFTFGVTTEGQLESSEDYYIDVYTPEGDALFSTDSDLMEEESDILKWVPPGKNTFIYSHRRAQEKILEWLDRQGFVDIFDKKLTKWAIVKENPLRDFSEVKEWSRYMVLRMIYEDVRNAPDDVIKSKRQAYESDEIAARQRLILRIDTDGDGTVDVWEGIDTSSIKLVMR